MNAILKYPGGKWRITDWIISHFVTDIALIKLLLQDVDKTG